MLGLKPAGTDAALDPPAREMVDRAEGLGQKTRVPVANAEDETPDTNPCRLEGHGPHDRQGFETVQVPALRGRLLEVIGYGKPIESHGVGEAPQSAHFSEWATEVADVDAERHSHGRRTSARRPLTTTLRRSIQSSQHPGVESIQTPAAPTSVRQSAGGTQRPCQDGLQSRHCGYAFGAVPVS